MRIGRQKVLLGQHSGIVRIDLDRTEEPAEIQMLRVTAGSSGKNRTV
jgi:hypothetical protein